MNEIRIIIEGLAELTAAINRLAGPDTASSISTPAAPPAMSPVPIQTGQIVAASASQVPLQTLPVAQQGQVPLQMPPMAQQGQTPLQGQPQQQPPLGAVPTSNPQNYTLEQLQVAAAGLMSAGKGQQIMGILQRFGIQAMTELPKERYGEFAMALRDAGAQV